jgi:hypothetical protein
MPAPSNRGKGKSKKRKPTSGSASSSRPNDTDEVYVVDIDNAEGWEVVVNILCDYFELPGWSNLQGVSRLTFHETFFYRSHDSKWIEESTCKLRHHLRSY